MPPCTSMSLRYAWVKMRNINIRILSHRLPLYLCFCIAVWKKNVSFDFAFYQIYIYISIYIKNNYFYGRMWARICCAAILQIPRETSSYLVSMFLLSDEVPEYRSLGAIASHKNSVNGKIPFFMVFLRNESFW